MSPSQPHSAANVKQVTHADVDERLAALIGNAAAVAALASVVEGTIGPKGLDCMLVDDRGDLTITNDGATILNKVAVSHPAAHLLIQAARAQDREVGDGTTTATILASALINASVDRIRQGVPIARLIEGIRAGLQAARAAVHTASVPVTGPDDPMLSRAALIAGREDHQIADLVTRAASCVPPAKLLHDTAFRLADCVMAYEGAESAVIPGLVLDKEPLNHQMPQDVSPARILLLDDALEPEPLGDEALATEAGLRRLMELRAEFDALLHRLLALQTTVILLRKGVAESAEAVLTEAGVLVVRRLVASDLDRVAKHVGARIIKLPGLKRPPEELERCLGRAEAVVHDRKSGHLQITGGAGEPTATILVGAATREIRDERQRMAEDAAAAIQAALRGGLLPGGGAAFIAAIPQVVRARTEVSTLAAYGVDCVVEALRRPMAQIVANAGHNPLEKIEAALARQAQENSGVYGVDCDTGEVTDMPAAGVVDPTLVTLHALAAAAEVTEAILRITTVIRKMPERPSSAGRSETDMGQGG